MLWAFNLRAVQLLGVVLCYSILIYEQNPAIGGNRAIFDQSLMSVTSHIISALNHRVSAREMLFFIVLYEHFL